MGECVSIGMEHYSEFHQIVLVKGFRQYVFDNPGFFGTAKFFYKVSSLATGDEVESTGIVYHGTVIVGLCPGVGMTRSHVEK